MVANIRAENPAAMFEFIEHIRIYKRIIVNHEYIVSALIQRPTEADVKPPRETEVG